MKKPRLKDISTREFIEIQRKIFNNDVIFTSSFEEIGKLFLSEYLDNVDNEPFESIRSKFIDSSNSKEESVPNQKDDFFKYICQTYLRLEVEPRFMMLELYTNASNDLKKIEQNIINCQKSIDETKRKNKDDIKYEDDYRIPMLEYFKNKNIEAKNEILNFIISDKIKLLAYRKSSCFRDAIFFVSMIERPYSFSYNSEIYDIDNFSVIKHKFYELYIDEISKLEELYKNDPDVFSVQLKNILSIIILLI